MRTGKSMGEDNTFLIYADVENTCENVLPGMYVKASVIESDSLVTALPSDAIVSFDDKNYIFVYERDKTESGMAFTEYKMVEVGKGVTSSGYTEVRLPGGFDLSGTRVVIRGAYNLLSAMKNAGEMAC
jgi:cobalt-zinc-cadmium efflux system membrane fusion protein